MHIKVLKDVENFSHLQNTANANYLFAQLLPAAVLWREIYIYIQVCILVITRITVIRPFVWQLFLRSEAWWDLACQLHTSLSHIPKQRFKIACLSDVYLTRIPLWGLKRNFHSYKRPPCGALPSVPIIVKGPSFLLVQNPLKHFFNDYTTKG